MHLDIREKIRMSYVSFPSLLDVLGLFPTSESLRHGFLRTRKTRRQSVQVNEGRQHVSSFNIVSTQIKDIFADRIIVCDAPHCDLCFLVGANTKTCRSEKWPLDSDTEGAQIVAQNAVYEQF